jgi:hypothetical protein
MSAFCLNNASNFRFVFLFFVEMLSDWQFWLRIFSSGKGGLSVSVSMVKELAEMDRIER